MVCSARSLLLFSIGLGGCAARGSHGVASHEIRTSCIGLLSGDSTVFDTTQVSEKPRALSGPVPDYPMGLRLAHIGGRVVLAAVINADGRADASSITVLRSDQPEFEREARRWVLGAVYAPGCRDGRAVRVRVAIPLDFRVKS